MGNVGRSILNQSHLRKQHINTAYTLHAQMRGQSLMSHGVRYGPEDHVYQRKFENNIQLRM